MNERPGVLLLLVVALVAGCATANNSTPSLAEQNARAFGLRECQDARAFIDAIGRGVAQNTFKDYAEWLSTAMFDAVELHANYHWDTTHPSPDGWVNILQPTFTPGMRAVLHARYGNTIPRDIREIWRKPLCRMAPSEYAEMLVWRLRALGGTLVHEPGNIVRIPPNAPQYPTPMRELEITIVRTAPQRRT